MYLFTASYELLIDCGGIKRDVIIGLIWLYI